MSEMHATQDAAPEIGNVLASIRRLIAQDDGGPDFSRPGRRTDRSGLARTTLPLGPRAERIRSVIEQELATIELADQRLVLGDGSRIAEQTPLPVEAVADPQQVLPDMAAPADFGPEPEPGFDEDAYRQAMTLGRGRGGDLPPAHITSITPHMGASRQPETMTEETEMMLAEINRTDLNKTAAAPQKDESFDLFAADANEDDDQLSGGNALRNLVRDVIRQELQGEMGDRISRNLRRAIRQEVASAIAAGLKTA